MKYFSIPNQRSTTVSIVTDPLTETKEPDYSVFKDDRKEYLRWCSNLATDAFFLSTCEGQAPKLRVHKTDNPLLRVHGVIAEYEGRLTDPEAQIRSARRGEFMPTYLCSTFGGNSNLIFEFEKPVYPIGLKHYKLFAARVSKALGLNLWLPGFKAELLGDPGRYYERGVNWIRLAEAKPISLGHLEKWLLDASEKLTLSDSVGQKQPSIPLERVKNEVEARFPGKWTQSFEVGSRGPAFWSNAGSGSSSNPCVLFKDGVYCFSETVGAGFYTWERILGKAFVEKFEVDRAQAYAEQNLFYDGEKYWQRTEALWFPINRSDFVQSLKVAGIDGRVPKGETCSPIDRLEQKIKTCKRVVAAMPFMFCPEGAYTYKGKPYLNTCQVIPMQPAPPFTEGPIVSFAEGRSHFPFIFRVLTAMFHDPEKPDIGAIQLERFLAWLKFFYVNAVKQTPRPGHAIVLAGPVGKGKTFLLQQILGPLMGGVYGDVADASGHLQGGERWTERLLETPIMAIDDTKAAADPREGKKMTARIKKYVSSPRMVYEQKYRAQAEIPWGGRIMILCNLDLESLRILPGMHSGVADKVSMFKASDARVKWENWEDNRRLVNEELPNFARFLFEWEIPKRSAGPEDERFGVKGYHHPELLDESLQAGLDGIVLELIITMQEKLRERGESGEWSGIYTALYELLSVTNERVMRDIKPRALATALGCLSSAKYNIRADRKLKSGTPVWHIGKDILEKQEDDKITPRQAVPEVYVETPGAGEGVCETGEAPSFGGEGFGI